jgi:hypothetical protein
MDALKVRIDALERLEVFIKHKNLSILIYIFHTHHRNRCWRNGSSRYGDTYERKLPETRSSQRSISTNRDSQRMQQHNRKGHIFYVTNVSRTNHPLRSLNVFVRRPRFLRFIPSRIFRNQRGKT